jgi:GDPmannose 4,6-dehydratase
MPNALVLGVNGQDGSYAAEALLRLGYSVVGVGRQAASRYVAASATFRFLQFDIADSAALLSLLTIEQPDVVFHLAAVHGAAGFQYEPVFAAMMAVNVAAVQTILEYARTQRPALRLVYANSAKIFPAPLVGAVNEQTGMRPTCLYSVGKLAALELIRYYRQRYNIAASNLILFNHESPRRAAEYFLPTLVAGLARSLNDRSYQFGLKTLDFWMDWSSAEELMEIAVDIGARAPDADFVLASGTTWHARKMAQQWFAHHGLDYTQHIVESLPLQEMGPAFSVELHHLQASIGRTPQRTAFAVAEELLLALRSH